MNIDPAMLSGGLFIFFVCGVILGFTLGLLAVRNGE